MTDVSLGTNGNRTSSSATTNRKTYVHGEPETCWVSDSNTGLVEYARMRVGVPRETATGERRVAVVPESLSKLTALGLETEVERGAGHDAAFTDDAYADAGGQLVDKAFDADLVAKVAPPSASEVGALRE